MNRLLKKVGAFLTILTFACISTILGSEASLYLFYNEGNAGEKSQVLGIARFLKQSLPDMTEKTFKLEDKETLLSDIRQNFREGSGNKGILVTAGNDGIALLAQLDPQPNMVMAHSSHQYTKDHGKLKDITDIVALPKHAITPETLESVQSPYTTVIQTIGVAHNLSPADIAQAYHDQKDILPDAPKYLGIILGGDAERPDKKVLYYTPEEAQQMAKYVTLRITKENPQPHLLILNGPRTGKHDPKTEQVIATSHRNGNIDPVTASFIETLKKQRLMEGKDFTLFDFQFQDKKPSPYRAVLGALLATHNPVLVAGESTSMVSETADCLPPGLVTVYTHGAMNENHRKHCESEHAGGRVHILENQGERWNLLKTAAVSSTQDTRPASQVIADAIQNRFKEKLSRH